MHALQNSVQERPQSRVASASTVGRVDQEQRAIDEGEDQKRIKELNEQLQANNDEIISNKIQIRDLKKRIYEAL